MPERFAGCEPVLGAFSKHLGIDSVLPVLRQIAVIPGTHRMVESAHRSTMRYRIRLPLGHTGPLSPVAVSAVRSNTPRQRVRIILGLETKTARFAKAITASGECPELTNIEF